MRSKVTHHTSHITRHAFCIACCVLSIAYCVSCANSLALAQEQFVYDDEGRRNPFIPLVSLDGRFVQLEKAQRKENKESKNLDFLVEGIIIDKYGSSYAIVNAKVVKVGDKLEGYQVLKIEEQKITLIKDGEPFVIEWKKEER
jgi:hypothetical protein